MVVGSTVKRKGPDRHDTSADANVDACALLSVSSVNRDGG